MRLPEHLSALAGDQCGLVTRAQLLHGGISREAIRWSAGRTTRLVLPRVLSLFTGRLDDHQRLVAASLWAGERSQLAGTTALRWHGGLELADDGLVHLLVDWASPSGRAGFAVRHRTRRLDPHALRAGPLVVCSRPRALVDAARGMRPAEARHLVIAAHQRGLVRLTDVRHELEAGPVRGSAAARQALRDVDAGAWSLPEAEVLDELSRSRILPPLWANPRLWAADGSRLPSPDVWADDVALAGQVHSRRHHAGVREFEATVDADALLAASGVVVVAVTPQGFRHDPPAYRERFERAYLASRARGHRPPVRALPRQLVA